MKKIKQLSLLLEKESGYIKTSDALQLDISVPYLHDFVKMHSLIKISRGLYKTEEAWTDELYEISILNKQICFSHETALYLNGLMEREPFEIIVSAPRSYNAAHLRNRNIHVFQLDKERYLLGKSECSTPLGHMVSSYNKERSICDLMRNKENTDIQIFQFAFKLYVNSSDKNLPLLMRYAKSFKIEETMRKYLEVLL